MTACRHGVRAALALGAAAAVAAGCSGIVPVVAHGGGAQQPGAAPPRSDPAATAPGPGVPKVANPIDVTRFKQNPCDALTSAQISDLLGGNARVKPDPHGPGGPACGWFSQAQLVVVFPAVDKLGLTSIYRAKGGAYPFFLPLDPADGYPVVAYGEADRRASDGACDIAVGTSDRETLVVSITQSPGRKGETDPCESARRIAGRVQANLRH
ncbi:DUF3558 domain-containing protein [Amycolatopsis sp. NPDC004079]|uniref:DUF3558 domain-containing protein n=1 Tax=Amycolatopsis sp. NPDC004079 TaxID=3154549 RepID=UPI0033AF33CF